MLSAALLTFAAFAPIFVAIAIDETQIRRNVRAVLRETRIPRVTPWNAPIATDNHGRML
jgi:hypothetical protein